MINNVKHEELMMYFFSSNLQFNVGLSVIIQEASIQCQSIEIRGDGF